MKKVANILFLLLIANACFAQSINDEIHFWRLTSLSGEFNLRGTYRNQKSITAGVEDNQQSALLSAGILLRTSSYFYSKKFLILDVDAEFNPETSTDKYLVVPDQAEVRTVGRLGISTLFFSDKPVTLTLFTHLDQGYSNRENLTNLKTNNKDLGGMLTFANKILPASISYIEAWSDVTEIPGGRIYNVHQKNLLAIADKSFGSRDKNELSYAHDYYLSQQNDLTPTGVTTDNITLLNSLYLDRMRKYHFNSYISWIDQTRSVNLNRWQVSETFNARLPQNLDLYTNYSFNKYDYLNIESNQNIIKGRLQHKLFESLTTGIFGEYNDTRQTYFHETIIKTGVDLTYQKKLPTKGLLTLGYRYELQNHKQTSDPLQIKILYEPHTLIDGKIELLNKAYVNFASVKVFDVTSSILYVLNLDYTLIQQNNYLQIQRIPGGQIANNATVLVTYDAIQPGSYKYDLNSHNASVNLMMFDQFIELYYRHYKQDFKNLQQTEFLTLDYITQNFYGVKFEYKIASVGMEYDDYQSSIIPYKMTHYFMAIQGDFKNKITYALMGHIRNYNMVADNLIQEYDDLTGNINYTLNMHSNAGLLLGYRYQKGTGIDLNLFTAHIEYNANFRQLYLTAGLDFYRRAYIGETLDFRGASIKISRRF